MPPVLVGILSSPLGKWVWGLQVSSMLTDTGSLLLRMTGGEFDYMVIRNLVQPSSEDTLRRIRSVSIESLPSDQDLVIQSDYILSWCLRDMHWLQLAGFQRHPSFRTRLQEGKAPKIQKDCQPGANHIMSTSMRFLPDSVAKWVPCSPIAPAAPQCCLCSSKS